jgi:shikimate kinase
MRRVAEAVSHGAITVVNAMATGRGAALGVKLWTRAKVTLTNQAGVFRGRIVGDPTEDTSLIETTARHVFSKFGADREFGALVETQSNIPIAVGLKSSSAASNAVALASLNVLGRKANDLETVKLGVKASLQAGVSITGAFDDACACYLGGLVVTDNKRRRILKRFRPTGNLRVLIQIPNRKKYTSDVDPTCLRGAGSSVQIAHQEAFKGNYWDALTLNGLIYCKALGYDSKPMREAFRMGSIATGLTGKGPAFVAIVPDRNAERVLSAWEGFPGKVIRTSFNFEKARPLKVTQ